MTLTSDDIAKIVKGKLAGRSDLEITDIATDSRQISFTDGVAFFAIRGKNHDGHLFIVPLYKRGIRTFILKELPVNHHIYSDAAFIITQDTVEALQILAAYKRNMFKSPVIAITGSAGKTIVKEWLADLLGQTTSVVRSPKSYNSQIGVPLSVWKLDEKYQLGIFEAGISRPGEMEKLRNIINPDIGVITNIGDAHNENFRSDLEKAEEKLRLFANTSMVIYCSDNATVKQLILEKYSDGTKRIVDWSSENKDASIFVSARSQSGGRTIIKMSYQGITDEFNIPFSDRASVENAVTVASVCLAMKTDKEIIRRGLAGLVSVAMRMEMKSGINNCQLIEDYYNSDPGSLKMAVEYLKSQNNRRSTLIMSDFLQSGRDETELYSEVAELINRAGIDKFIGIGQALMRSRSSFGSNAAFYYSTDDFLHSFRTADFSNEIILLKGARMFEFERIGKILEQQVHQTVLEINLDAIAHNLNEFRRYLKPSTRIMVMVKAFAYGAGPAEIASLLEYHRVSYLGVAYADEGVELRNAGVTLPVMVMNPDPASSELMIKYNLEPEIFSFSSLERFSEVASRHGLVHYPVHIKVDSGMHRLGFMPEDTDKLISKITRAESIKIISVFSHLSCSEDPSCDQFTHRQVEVFLKVVDQIRAATGYPFLTHICNSSGIVRFPQYQFDMVRPGIGIYGAGNFEKLNLKVAGRFRTKISQVKIIPAGEPVGYGCADVSDKERTIAILPVGYADGLNRKLGNGTGALMIKGSRIPIIGNICMDMCMADITGLDADEGDEAEIFGENISIDEIAKKCQTIPYEILTSIPGRVKRIFYRE
ncbi:MAG: bifunctional UDP-N-acetylmuramoyl-tripeptide:D-alanyl-D-alanine ligase/alanine racemase [Bacteroidales bacterium]|nr:bifunctional UDP-N-acetylmuramoyl-tripeptide:D-alanyl-D-alanine ligase/alanine racemase [Bacteroidales bacterium]